MRSIEHPGPVHPTRIECVPANVRAVEVELPPGVTLLQGLANAVQAQGATSAVFSFRDGSFAPLRFVMPALADSPKHVAYFSERFESARTGFVAHVTKMLTLVGAAPDAAAKEAATILDVEKSLANVSKSPVELRDAVWDFAVAPARLKRFDIGFRCARGD